MTCHLKFNVIGQFVDGRPMWARTWIYKYETALSGLVRQQAKQNTSSQLETTSWHTLPAPVGSDLRQLSGASVSNFCVDNCPVTRQSDRSVNSRDPLLTFSNKNKTNDADHVQEIVISSNSAQPD